jgi:hypothetical protein
VPRELEPERREHVHEKARAIEPAFVTAPTVRVIQPAEGFFQDAAARERTRGGKKTVRRCHMQAARVGEENVRTVGRKEQIFLRIQGGAVARKMGA